MPMDLRCSFRRIALCLLAWLAGIGLARAQNTANSQLLVTMSVQSSISLEFVNGPNAGNQGSCSISGAGTSTAAINFGIASLATDSQSCVSFSHTSTSYTLSNNVYAVVTQSNLSSSGYSLTASLASAPPTGVTWAINSATLGTGTSSVTANGGYGNQLAMYLQVTVASTVASGSLSQTINFVAMAN